MAWEAQERFLTQALHSCHPLQFDHSQWSCRERDSNIPGSDYINANYVKVGVLAGHGGKRARGPRLLGMLGQRHWVKPELLPWVSGWVDEGLTACSSLHSVQNQLLGPDES